VTHSITPNGSMTSTVIYLLKNYAKRQMNFGKRHTKTTNILPFNLPFTESKTKICSFIVLHENAENMGFCGMAQDEILQYLRTLRNSNPLVSVYSLISWSVLVEHIELY